eukprot:2889489-Pleurochrysis_carterae.AAC.5
MRLAEVDDVESVRDTRLRPLDRKKVPLSVSARVMVPVERQIVLASEDVGGPTQVAALEPRLEEQRTARHQLAPQWHVVLRVIDHAVERLAVLARRAPLAPPLRQRLFLLVACHRLQRLAGETRGQVTTQRSGPGREAPDIAGKRLRRWILLLTSLECIAIVPAAIHDDGVGMGAARRAETSAGLKILTDARSATACQDVLTNSLRQQLFSKLAFCSPR